MYTAPYIAALVGCKQFQPYMTRATKLQTQILIKPHYENWSFSTSYAYTTFGALILMWKIAPCS